MTQRKTIPIQPVTAPTEGSSCEDAEPFALMVLDDVMEPEFQHRDIIVIEPEGLAHDGSFVVVEHEGEFYFRQLEIRGEEWFIKPLNPKYPTLKIAGPSAVKGVVVLKKKAGRRKEQKSYV